MAKPIGFFKEDGKTKPIIPRTSKSSKMSRSTGSLSYNEQQRLREKKSAEKRAGMLKEAKKWFETELDAEIVDQTPITVKNYQDLDHPYVKDEDEAIRVELDNGEDWTIYDSWNPIEDRARQSLEAELDSVDDLRDLVIVDDFLMDHYDMSETDKRITANEDASFRVEDMDESDVRDEAERYGLKSTGDIDTVKEKLEEELTTQIKMEIEDDPVEYIKGLGYSDDDIHKGKTSLRLWNDDYDSFIDDVFASDGYKSFIPVEETGTTKVYETGSYPNNITMVKELSYKKDMKLSKRISELND